MNTTKIETKTILGNTGKAFKADEIKLIERAVDTLYFNMASGEEYPWHPYRCIRPSARGFRGIWNWDSAYHAIGVSYWDTELAREQILGFIQYQKNDGMFPDVVWVENDINMNSSKPPILCSAAEVVYNRDRKIEFLKEVYPAFVNNERFWTEKRKYKGLFYYDADPNLTTFEEYELNIRWESGWDNSVRWDKPIRDLWAVDLNCYMVMMYRSLAFMAGELQFEDDAKLWRSKELQLNNLIEENFWNEELMAYTDKNRFNGEYSDTLTPASFMPLYIEIASKARAEAMAKIGGDKHKFFPGMPTVSYDNSEFSTDYWRGPMWLNVAYYAAKGIKNYGYTEIAEAIKEKILTWVKLNENAIYENYNSITGEGLNSADFSWSAVFVLEFLLNF